MVSLHEFKVLFAQIGASGVSNALKSFELSQLLKRAIAHMENEKDAIRNQLFEVQKWQMKARNGEALGELQRQVMDTIQEE